MKLTNNNHLRILLQESHQEKSRTPRIRDDPYTRDRESRMEQNKENIQEPELQQKLDGRNIIISYAGQSWYSQ